MRAVFLHIAVVFAVAVAGLAAGAPAQAGKCGCASEPWPCTKSVDINAWWMDQDFTPSQKEFFSKDFYQDKMVNEFWQKNMYPALQKMTAQRLAADTLASASTGKMMDAENQLTAQRDLQRLQAEAYKDYTPSDGLCRFGSTVGGLAASSMSAQGTARLLDRVAESRALNKKEGASDTIEISTAQTKGLNEYCQTYMDPSDNNGQAGALCAGLIGKGKPKAGRFNKDIDLAALMSKATLDLRPGSEDFQDVLALSRQLYAYKALDEKSIKALEDDSVRKGSLDYLNLRTVAALHNVAQNSFNIIVAQRTGGDAAKSGSSAPFLKAAIKELGLTNGEVETYLTGSANGKVAPSYYAQMQVLAKKIYQNPNFYTDLMDKPANIKRQMAAMKAIDLMVGRDIYESAQRQSMLISLMLELAVRKAQSGKP